MDRREQITAEITARTGIEEPMIERLVRRFYAKIRVDALLGPIFEGRIPRLGAASPTNVRLLVVGRAYVGGITAPPWSSTCRSPSTPSISTAGSRCSRSCTGGLPAHAEAHFVERARRIAESLELGIAGRHGVLIRKGERSRNGSLLEGMSGATP